MFENIEFMCLTSDPGNWCIPAFLHQWDKYGAGLPMNIYGYTKPKYAKFATYPFTSIGRPEFYPVNKWSDGLLRALSMIREKGKQFVALFLEDYWLIRPINLLAVQASAQVMEKYNIVRLDLTSDRALGTGPRRDLASINDTDFFISHVPDYQFSTQASLWDIVTLDNLLRSGETPWESELNGNKRLLEARCRVVGTYQWPVRYMIAVNKGQLDRSGDWMYPQRTLSPEDWQELDVLGLLSYENQAK